VDVLIKPASGHQPLHWSATAAASAIAESGLAGVVRSLIAAPELSRNSGCRTPKAQTDRSQTAAVLALDHDYGPFFRAQVLIGSGHGNGPIWGRCTWKLSLSCPLTTLSTKHGSLHSDPCFPATPVFSNPLFFWIQLSYSSPFLKSSIRIASSLK
jgi:hypothetical protein